jgi:hypothetical protein
MNTSTDPDFNRIMNLIRFNINFSKFDRNMILLNQSPGYIMEKYILWIGFEPIRDSLYTPDDLTTFIWQYSHKWGRSYSSVKKQLMYLKSTEDINIISMVRKFEEFIGPISSISSKPKPGLHEVLERDFVPSVIEKNKENITIVLRDLKLSNLV